MSRRKALITGAAVPTTESSGWTSAIPANCWATRRSDEVGAEDDACQVPDLQSVHTG